MVVLGEGNDVDLRGFPLEVALSHGAAAAGWQGQAAAAGILTESLKAESSGYADPDETTPTPQAGHLSSSQSEITPHSLGGWARTLSDRVLALGTCSPYPPILPDVIKSGDG